MKDMPAQSFSYRGVAVTVQMECARGLVFGHADLLAGGEFMGRVALGGGRSADEVRERLRCLAKAKIDLTEVIRTAEAECTRSRPTAGSLRAGSDGPDGISDVVGNQQGAVRRLRKAHRRAEE